ncbi:hypothetical protein SPIRO4BDMA_40047 [uncultured spirochete]|uniref:Uncharacterized protein n=1 Tax=uncultured spirochete TaxID=156406 RepID=A0A3P3XMI9_9SPIR|nr:hypothetical protein SPIRO4BDMA_40047 [uncultured spirochete]
MRFRRNAELNPSAARRAFLCVSTGFGEIRMLAYYFHGILRAVAQGLARLVRDQDVGGSNPLSPIDKKAAISFASPGGLFIPIDGH